MQRMLVLIIRPSPLGEGVPSAIKDGNVLLVLVADNCKVDVDVPVTDGAHTPLRTTCWTDAHSSRTQ